MNSKELPHFPSSSPVDVAIALAAQRAAPPDSDDEVCAHDVCGGMCVHMSMKMFVC